MTILPRKGDQCVITEVTKGTRPYPFVMTGDCLEAASDAIDCGEGYVSFQYVTRDGPKWTGNVKVRVVAGGGVNKEREFGFTLLRDSLHWTPIESLTTAHMIALRDCVAILGRDTFARQDFAELRRELVRADWRVSPPLENE